MGYFQAIELFAIVIEELRVELIMNKVVFSLYGLKSPLLSLLSEVFVLEAVQAYLQRQEKPVFGLLGIAQEVVKIFGSALSFFESPMCHSSDGQRAYLVGVELQGAVGVVACAAIIFVEKQEHCFFGMHPSLAAIGHKYLLIMPEGKGIVAQGGIAFVAAVEVLRALRGKYLGLVEAAEGLRVVFEIEISNASPEVSLCKVFAQANCLFKILECQLVVIHLDLRLAAAQVVIYLCRSLQWGEEQEKHIYPKQSV